MRRMTMKVQHCMEVDEIKVNLGMERERGNVCMLVCMVSASVRVCVCVPAQNHSNNSRRGWNEFDVRWLLLGGLCHQQVVVSCQSQHVGGHLCHSGCIERLSNTSTRER